LVVAPYAAVEPSDRQVDDEAGGELPAAGLLAQALG